MANRFGVGTPWNDTNSWSAVSGGAGGAGIPTASDDVKLDANSVSMAIDVNAVCLSIDATGYTATLTQNATFTLTVGTGGIIWVGTFVGGDSNIDNSGIFTLTSGTWTSTTATFFVDGNWTNTGAGVFTHNGGTVEHGGGTATTNVNVSETFNNFIINLTQQERTLTAGDTLIITGTLTLNTQRLLGGTLEVQGDVVIGSIAGQSTSALRFTGGATQNYTDNSINGINSTIEIAKDVGTIVDFGTGSINLANDITITTGTFKATTGTMFISSGNWTNTGSGVFDANGGTVEYDGGQGTFNVNVSETYNNLTLNMSVQELTITPGDTLIVTGTLKYVRQNILTGTIEARGNVVVEDTWSGTISSTALTFSGAASQTYSQGTARPTIASITINKTGGTITQITTATFDATGQDMTLILGHWCNNGFDLTIADVLTIDAAATLTEIMGSTISFGSKVGNIRSASSCILGDQLIGNIVKDVVSDIVQDVIL